MLLLPLVVIFILSAVIYWVRVSPYKITAYINEAGLTQDYRLNVFIVRIKYIYRA